MLKAHDSEILGYVADPERKAYVCFRGDEDFFLVLNFDVPEEYSWSPDKQGNTQTGLLRLVEYKSGLLEDFQAGSITWRKLKRDNDEDAIARTDGKVWLGARKADATIDRQEITISYPFTNAKGGITDYVLRIRRATKRFVEDFAVKTDHTQFSINGYCGEYGAN
jgi:hypothetical protein